MKFYSKLANVCHHKKTSKFLVCKSSITIYKAFIGPDLDNRDTLYDQPNRATFWEKIVSVQYKAALAITGAIKSIS